jgi:hypothetical protein
MSLVKNGEDDTEFYLNKTGPLGLPSERSERLI